MRERNQNKSIQVELQNVYSMRMFNIKIGSLSHRRTRAIWTCTGRWKKNAETSKIYREKKILVDFAEDGCI